jgi:hypothetical protein
MRVRSSSLGKEVLNTRANRRGLSCIAPEKSMVSVRRDVEDKARMREMVETSPTLSESGGSWFIPKYKFPTGASATGLGEDTYFWSADESKDILCGPATETVWKR